MYRHKTYLRMARTQCTKIELNLGTVGVMLEKSEQMSRNEIRVRSGEIKMRRSKVQKSKNFE